MKKRSSSRVRPAVSLPEAETAFFQFNEACTTLEALETEMNEELNIIRESYVVRRNQLNIQKEANLIVLKEFAQQEKHLWGNSKSLKMLPGRIGFKLGNHSVKCLPNVTWKDVLKKLENSYPQYVRKNPEIDKALLLKDRSAPHFAQLCRNLKIQVVQAESFFIEANTDSLHTPQTV